MDFAKIPPESNSGRMWSRPWIGAVNGCRSGRDGQGYQSIGGGVRHDLLRAITRRVVHPSTCRWQRRPATAVRCR